MFWRRTRSSRAASSCDASRPVLCHGQSIDAKISTTTTIAKSSHNKALRALRIMFQKKETGTATGKPEDR